jgi:Trk K+ transport system NAD-binding subunit
MRRMRAPLILLVCAYSIAILGLVLIPGEDPDGNVWHMDFLHAFYFVSFMASTTGFGEIPYEFTSTQRLWVTITIYLTVVVWLYSIGTIIGLVQDPAFRQALREKRFAAQVRRLREKFFIICGYGETGRELVHSLTCQDCRAVVVEEKRERINALQMESLHKYVPGLCGDAGNPDHMLMAGLNHRMCAGVVALSSDNAVNLKTAITSKLLNKDIKVICRADSYDVEANMDSFGTDHIVDPFDLFSHYLATAFQSPCLYLLQEWLLGDSSAALKEPLYPPKEGRWIICGYGRFGKAVYKRLYEEGIEVAVIEMTPEKTGQPKGRFIKGRGTEAVTLKDAGVESAIGLVAGTDDDVNNLSIIMTAQELNPNLFVILRQNRQENDALFEAVKKDMWMHPSSIIANRIRMLLSNPMLADFLERALSNDNEWACELVSRIAALVEDRQPGVWEIEINDATAPAYCRAIKDGVNVTLETMMKLPSDRERKLLCIPLMYIRRGIRTLQPKINTSLQTGDKLLFCGRSSSDDLMRWGMQNEDVLSYLLTGEYKPEGALWKWLSRKADSEPEPE